MSRDLGPDSDTDHEPPDSTASDDLYGKNEADEPRMVDQSGSGGSLDNSEEEFSLVDPLFYAPLLLVGVALVAFPEPLTSVLGVAFIAAGLFVAVLDLRSPDEPA